MSKCIVHILSVFLFVWSHTCFSQDVHAKQHDELGDIKVHQKPSTIAKDIGKLQKKQEKAYKKQLKKTRKRWLRSNKKKQQGKVFGE